ncbi:branched-chain amino acid-Na+ symporter [Brochothrix thermosphacta]|uniref:Branched-chain amino acid transport system carrier protein n=2 Tax=Brochothrix thermosphacta TaxID=2756 RepID=A0A2X0QXM2_BROTH|nr:Branched-chain amino acid transport system carrier protein [Brachybacterium faecium]SOC27162.1 branched-chain amino acid-Na+ symporter [Brochothrix thermosphacta]SPN73123.1 branched-chain amino acid-Na+ symporter [Brochothrix thermosphacta]SPN74345.1 branched-chain amino acid-Na+ symporter [Brochothrix thermosphacta]SPP28928.1 branched-chain amino acid-Na+ symporter [Brochothrix thermosphacta]
MMDKRIGFSAYIAIGLMLFALFFGAGNLIFPAFLGQEAGDHVWPAIIGFLITGTGLPFLGILAIGLSGKEDLQSLASRVHPIYGLIFTIVLYLTIGPLFALPRTGTVSFEVGVAPFLEADQMKMGLAIFTAVFFGVTLWLSLSPSKIVDRVGKILTPILLAVILVLIAASIFKPMGTQTAATGKYINDSFISGFLEGYMTMDALAALVFGIIVVNAVKSVGAKTRKEVAVMCTKTGLIAIGLLAFIYVFIALIGAQSVDELGMQANGSPVLSGAATFYFGSFGKVLLAAIVFLACLTTSIGLVTACASYFNKLLPRINYKTFVVIFAVFGGLVANIGLDKIISYSVPVLMAVYPLTVVLVLLTFLNGLIGGRRVVYVTTVLFTAVISITEFCKALEINLGPIDTFFANYLPFYDISMGWVVMGGIGLVVGWIIALLTKPSVKPDFND